jgi:transketolase
MRDSFVRTIVGLLDRDPATALVLADIGYARFAETGIVDRHRNRVINVGIREQTLIGVAAGLALEGFRPFVHSYTPFLVERPFEQIKLDLVHQGLGAVLVSVGGSFDAAGEGMTHLSPADVSVLATLPDVDIHVPGHPDEVEGLMRIAAATTNTVYIRLAEAVNKAAFPTDGLVHVVKEGSRDAQTILAVGPMLDPLREATADLDITLAYATTVRPFDGVGLRTVATGSEVTLVEPYLEGTGLPAVVDAFQGIPKRYRAIGVGRDEVRKYGSRADHERTHGLDAASLRKRLETDGQARSI